MQNIDGEGKQIDTETLSEMWKIRSQDFANCNISENNFVYQICKDSYEAAMSGRALVNDPNSHHALRKMAGIGLYLKQQQRDKGKIVYDNPMELLDLFTASKSLKVFHPDLYEKYAYEKNLDVLCKLQLSRDLSEPFQDRIKSAYAMLNENGTRKVVKEENEFEEK